MEQIAVFDFDGTLTKRDTLWLFLLFSQNRVKLAACLILFSPLYLTYRLGAINRHRAKEILFSLFFRNLPSQKFDSLCKEFSKSLDGYIRADTMNILQEHIAHGTRIIIVSASFENWIKHWAKPYGIDVIATQIEIGPDGLLTGKLKSPNCYGAEKVRQLEKILPDRKKYHIFAYGNSRGDREMLNYADEGKYV